MQLTELLYQRVRELGAQGQIALRPGYVAIVSRAAAVRAALIAPLFPGVEDQRKLVDGPGPVRIGIGVLGDPSAPPHRLLREVGGNRQLQRFDAAAKKFVTITEDQLEIDSFLRVDCGLPPADAYTGFFVLEANELPSLRSGAGSGQAAVVDQVKVKALKEELELTKKFEATQDRLYKVQARLHDLKTLRDKVQAAEDELKAVEGELGRAPWTAEEMTDLKSRASRAKEELKKRDDALAEIAQQRQKALYSTPEPPEPFLKNPWFGGGLAGGLLLDALAFAFGRPSIALLALLPFAGALVAVLRFIQADEADKEAAGYSKRLKEREDAARKTYAEEQAPLKAALKAANADSAEELISLFKEREATLQRRGAAKARLDKVRADPEVARIPIETPLLESERARLEEAVQAQGFSRAINEIEVDLKHALGLGDKRVGAILSDAEMPKHLVDRAAELMNLGPEELWAQMAPRLAAYVAALTDKRVVSAKPDPKGLLLVSAADGRTGAYMTLPAPLRDATYAALRLALLERVASYKRLPIVIDDAFAPLEPAKRALVAKMLKGISTQTQVIHRSTEPPPAGTADAVVQA